jgi:DNA-binding LacI/PurR family transcriptional regulator
VNCKNNISHSDIAEMVNVTRSTVSRALDPKRSHLVGKATRAKIRETASNLGFTPNIHARRVKNSCSETITLVMDSIAPEKKYYGIFNQYHHNLVFELMDGVVNGAIDEGFEVKLMPLNSRKAIDRDFLIKHLEFPYSDGVIFLGYSKMRKFYDVIKNCNTPLLIVSGSAIPDLEIPLFSPNPETGIKAAAEYLVSKGHRHFAYHAFNFSTPPFYQQERFEQWEKVLLDLDSSITLETIEAPDLNTIRNLSDSFAQKHKFTALLAANDGAAQIWRNELQLRGIKIPDDIAIIGYDGNNSFEDIASVCVPFYEMAYAASNKLAKIAKEKKSVEISSEWFDTTFKQGKTI